MPYLRIFPLLTFASAWPDFSQDDIRRINLFKFRAAHKIPASIRFRRKTLDPCTYKKANQKKGNNEK
jgi:hypothetical protein